MNLKHLPEELIYMSEDLKSYILLFSNPYSHDSGEKIINHLLEMGKIISEMKVKVKEDFR